jgi:hypothetical protein
MTVPRTEDIVTQSQDPRKTAPLIAAVALMLGLSGCTGTPEASAPAEPGLTQTPSPHLEATTSEEGEQSEDTPDGIVGTVVHFTTGDVLIEVVIEEDNPTTRSFLAMLPMTLEFSDFGGKEKVATPTGEWDFTDAEGVDPEVGDLFSYMPWGNIGFFYNADGNTFSNDLTRIGETSDIDLIQLLDGEQVTIAVVG